MKQYSDDICLNYTVFYVSYVVYLLTENKVNIHQHMNGMALSDSDYYSTVIDLNFESIESILSKSFKMWRLSKIKVYKTLSMFCICNFVAFISTMVSRMAEKTSIERIYYAPG